MTLTGALFVLTTLFALWSARRAFPEEQRARLVALLVGWASFQALVALLGFYDGPVSLPPRFALAIMPPFVTLVILVVSPRGRRWLHRLDPSALILLHVVRIPVELLLHRLFVEGSIPEVMTWEGRNADLLSGVAALFLHLWTKRVGPASRRVLLVWNAVGLLLVLSVFIHGLLSAPSPFQQFSTPNGDFALLHAPFVWLPSVIVPLVVLAHLAALVQLLAPAQSASSKP